MRGLITISKSNRQGASYEISIVKQDGRSVLNISAGNDIGNVAALATQYAIAHCYNNDSGGDIVGPANILNIIPAQYRSVPPKSERK